MGAAPIWDLTALLLVARWNGALDALMRYGRADEVERLANEIGRPAQKAAHQAKDTAGRDQAKYLQDLGRAARAYADDLALGRMRDLMAGGPNREGSASALAQLLREEQAMILVDRIPALRGAMQALADDVAPLIRRSVLAPEAFPAWTHLARIYGRLQRFAEHAMVLREGLVTRFGHLTGADCPEPGAPRCKEARTTIEGNLGALAKAQRDGKPPNASEPLLAVATLANRVHELRNDIEHGGLNEHPMPAKSLRDTLAKSQEALLALSGAGACVNLTNHPSSTWSPPQLEGARALGLGELVDLDEALPLVEPTSSAADVLATARGLAERAIAKGAAGAIVQGEHTLTFALVSELERRGVRCFAATTARNVREDVSPDGSATIRRSEYRFEMFREYVRRLE